MYAGFWRRFAALLIDSLLAGAVGFFIGVVIGILVAAAGGDDVGDGWSALVNVASVAGWFLYFALISALILYIGFIMAAFTERKQALHDLIASALVVKRSEQPVTKPLEASV